MVSKYIKRDFSDHLQTVEYVSDDDEYIMFEVFPFDPIFTKTYTALENTLSGENCSRVNWKDYVCFRSKDKVTPMEFTINYPVVSTGEYCIDIVYEQSSRIYSDDIYNSSNDLNGWYDIYAADSKQEHTAVVNSIKNIRRIS